MGEQVWLNFGASASLDITRHVLSNAVDKKQDALFDETRGVVRGLVVASSLPTPPLAESRRDSNAEIATDTWDGKVQRVVRESFPATRLPEVYWHPERSVVKPENQDEFLDHLRFILEACDHLDGTHVVTQADQGFQASVLLEKAGDDFGMQRRHMFLALVDDSLTPSPLAALCAGRLGVLCSNYIPVVCKDHAHSKRISHGLDLLTLPHRMNKTFNLSMATNLWSVSSIPGEIPIGTLNIAQEYTSMQHCWGMLSVATSEALLTKSRTVQARFARHERIVAHPKVAAGLGEVFVDKRGASALQDLLLQTKSLAAARLFQGLGMEKDEVATMAETLQTSAECMLEELQ